MEKPTLSNTDALVQATWTTHHFMHAAIDMIDEVFGKGHAIQHPSLVASFISAQAQDLHTTAIMAAIWDAGDSIGHSLGGIENRLENHLDYIGTMIGNITPCDHN